MTEVPPITIKNVSKEISGPVKSFVHLGSDVEQELIIIKEDQ